LLKIKHWLALSLAGKTGRFRVQNLMKIRSLYKNLDTVFVNLSALLRYLRQRGFVGVVRVDIQDHKTEIIFDETQRVRLREFSTVTGKMPADDGALQRLLIRAREPGGLINVYQAVDAADAANAAATAPTAKATREEIEREDILELTPPETVLKEQPVKPEPAKIPKPSKPVEKVFAAAFENGNGSGNGKSANGFQREARPKLYSEGNDDNAAGQESFPIYSHPVEIIEEKPQEKPQEKLEVKKKASYLSPQDWKELITLTASLLSAADNILKAANLGFTDAFDKARLEISNEYPFLHPAHETFLYAHGRVIIREEINPALLVSGVSECLRRILNKLVANPKFFTLYKRITQQILILVRQRQPQFDKFGYTRQLERIIKF
jgi:hypothetical protein